jgi:hypothetical protein
MVSKYSNEYLQKKYPVIEGDKSFRNQRNIIKWFQHKRHLKCPECGREKTISKKLLMKISKEKYDMEEKKDV